MPGECWKKVQYIRTGCFQNRQNAPSTGIFYQLKTCINNARFKVRWIWNTAKLRCHLPSALEHTEWETVSFTMFCALTNIQVSNSLCLDGPSLGRNSFDFHLLVISHYVCFGMFFPIYWHHWHLRLLHWVSPGLRRRHLEYHLKVSITHIAKTTKTTKIEISGQNTVAEWGGL